MSLPEIPAILVINISIFHSTSEISNELRKRWHDEHWRKRITCHQYEQHMVIYRTNYEIFDKREI